jgi:ABC-2 type transport system permease protein
VPLYETLIQVFFQVGAFATAIGVITTAQGANVREKQLGTAAWILSKPVSHSAFVLAKFVGYATGFLNLAIMLPSAIFYGQSLLLAGRAPEPAGFLAGVGIVVLHTLFYLALTLMLGTLFNTRGPIGGIAMGVLFAGFLLPNVMPQAAVLAYVALRTPAAPPPSHCCGQGVISLQPQTTAPRQSRNNSVRSGSRN